MGVVRELPSNNQTLGVKWVYITKLMPNGEIQKYKAKFVVKGYKQEHGVNYDKIFAHVTRIEIFRLNLSLPAQNWWKVYQMDAKFTFLNGYLKQEIFVEQCIGYVKKGPEEKTYKLKKVLYGLKQASQTWYSRVISKGSIWARTLCPRRLRMKNFLLFHYMAIICFLLEMINWYVMTLRIHDKDI